MPSPVGHALIGLAAANIVLRQKLYQSVGWLLFVVFAANAADLDFLPGWLAGDINRFHHGISHSIGMAFIFACLCVFISRRFTEQSRWVFILALVLYLSHLLADYLGVDRVEPYGAPFLWPLSEQYYLAPLQLFQPIEHGNLGETSLSVFAKIFSLKNLLAVLIEVIIIGPLWGVTLWFSRRNKQRHKRLRIT